ncbi:acetyl-CoA C-acetyltransferase [Enterococcus sp. AZ150]
MEKIVIIEALRTPVGKYKGVLSDFQAVDLGGLVTKEIIQRQPSLKDKIDYVVFGNVLQAGNGQNPARQIALHSGLDVSVPAVTVNEVCGSGLKAISHARQMLLLNEADLVIAGGTESMTNAPTLVEYNRKEDTYRNPRQVMFVDGLTDAFSGQAMGMTAEKVAETFSVSREMQDHFAYQSQKKAAKAQENQWFEAEMLPIVDANDQKIAFDEGIRPQTTMEKLAELKTVFKENGTVTAGNASTINDGASALLLCTKSYALAHDIPYLAEIEDIVEVGIDPSIMGISPITAIEKLFERNALTSKDIDLFEINEAFAASSVVVQDKLNLEDEKVNITGGGISLGHPIGATGARIVTTLIHQLKRTNQHTGVASLCVGGGLGLALLLKVPEE